MALPAQPSAPPAPPAIVTIIWPNGTVSNPAAPIRAQGNSYFLTANFTGSILVERNGSTLDGSGHALRQAAGTTAAVEVYGTTAVRVTNLTIPSSTLGVLSVATVNTLVTGGKIASTGWAIEANDSVNTTLRSNSAEHTQGVLVQFTSGSSVTGNDLRFSGVRASWIRNSSGVQVVGNQVDNSTTGIEIDNSTSVQVSTNNCTGTQTGILLSYASGAALRTNNVSRARSGITILNSTEVTASGDVGSGTAVGARAYLDQSLTLIGEEFPHASSVAIEVDRSTSVSVERSSMAGSLGVGLRVGNSTGIDVERDNVSGYLQTGAAVSYSSNVWIANLTALPGAGSRAIGIFTLLDQNITEIQNLAVGSRSASMDEGSSQVVITQNDFSNSTGSGSAISASDDRQVQVLQNSVQHASNVAIACTNTAGLVVASNNASAAGWASVEVNRSSGVNVSNNQVGQSLRFGIELVHSSGLQISGNAGSASAVGSARGIYGTGLGQGTVSGNSFYGFNVSLDIELSSGILVTENNFSASTFGMQLLNDLNTSVIANQLWEDRDSFAFGGDLGLVVYHNDFLNDSGWQLFASVQSIRWDAWYPGGGNYWSNDTGPDLKSGVDQSAAGSDGVVDHALALDQVNRDRYPLVQPWVPHYLIFTESGLLPRTSWSLVFDGITFTIPGPTLVFPQTNAPNATFEFSTILPTGYASVSPAPQGQIPERATNLTYLIVFVPLSYPLIFQEYGLAPNTSWSIVVGSAVFYSSTDTVRVNEINGGYAYLASQVSGYLLYNGGGEAFVLNGTQVVDLFYRPILPPANGPPSPGTVSVVVAAALGAGDAALGTALLLSVVLRRKAGKVASNKPG